VTPSKKFAAGLLRTAMYVNRHSRSRSKPYTHTHAREKARRVRQMASGMLRPESGGARG
jgi:hypothetical protein